MNFIDHLIEHSDFFIPFAIVIAVFVIFFVILNFITKPPKQ